MKTIPLLFSVLLSGCTLFHGAGRAKIGKNIVTPPVNAASATVLNSGEGTSIKTEPAGTVVTVTETLPSAQEPAKKVTQTIYPAPVVTTEHKVESHAEIAPPRAPDRTVELRKVDNAERRLFLYAAAICGLACVFFVYRAFPTPAMLSGGAAVVCVLAWYAAGNTWIMAGAIGLVAIGTGIFLGYERHAHDITVSDLKKVVP